MNERANEMTEAKRIARRRAREERIRRLDEEFNDLMRQNRVIFDKWRAEGILPPEEPRRRF